MALHRDTPEPMLIDERRRYILDLILREGRVLTADIASQFGVSRITIRKDLEDLHDRGLIRRTHGGALAVQSKNWSDLSSANRQNSHTEEKQRIAAAAALYVTEGQCIILDSGTTATAVARALRGFSHLTVITHAVNIAAELSNTDFEVILTGGALRRNSMSLVGPLTEDALRDMHADIFFLGADGIDDIVGVTTPDVLESRVGRAMVNAAQTVIVVTDSSKFGRQSLVTVVPPSEIDVVITDTNIRPGCLERLRSAGCIVNLV